MELTCEILEKNGYTCNHPDFVLKKYSKHGNENSWNISIEQKYIPKTNILGWSMVAWKVDPDRHIQLSTFQTVEDLNTAIGLARIDQFVYC